MGGNDGRTTTQAGRGEREVGIDAAAREGNAAKRTMGVFSDNAKNSRACAAVVVRGGKTKARRHMVPLLRLADSRALKVRQRPRLLERLRGKTLHQRRHARAFLVFAAGGVSGR